MSNVIERDLRPERTSTLDRLDMRVGSAAGLQGHVAWEDPAQGRCIVTILRDHESIWSTIDMATDWAVLSTFLRGLSNALSEVMGWPECDKSGVGIAFTQQAPHGLAPLRFERVGSKLDVVSGGRRVRWHFGDSVRTFRFVGEEIAGKAMALGAFDDDLVSVWAPHVPGDFYATGS